MIKYRDSDHSYTANGQKYISATSLISKFKGYTDWEEVARKYAEKHKKNNPTAPEEEFTGEFWRSKWKNKADNACNIGSRFHKKKEDTLVPGFIPVDEDVRQPLTNSLEDLEDGVYAEMILWIDEFSIAGQADKIIIETKGLKRYADILDYKTNEKIDLESYKHPRDGYKMMQGCLKHLQDCNYVHYNLQLSLYAYILEQAGFIPRILQVEHYPLRTEDGEVDYEQEPVIYSMKYLKKEIVDMLKHYKKNNK